MRKLFGVVLLITISLTLVLNGCAKQNIPTRNLMSGTFRLLSNSQIIEFSDPWGYLVECKRENCSRVFFDMNSSGGINQVYDQEGNTTTGIIKKVTYYQGEPIGKFPDNPSVEYVINYKFNSIEYNSSYLKNLCSYFQGGDRQCEEPSNVNDLVILRVVPNNPSSISIVFTVIGKIQEAEVISLYPLDVPL